MKFETPMNGVLGMTYLALTSATDRRFETIYKRFIYQVSICYIVDDILDFSKIDWEGYDRRRGLQFGRTDE